MIAVYTAIYGGYDPLREQPEIPGVEYICFTDDPTLKAKPWRVEYQAPRYEHPNLPPARQSSRDPIRRIPARDVIGTNHIHAPAWH